MANDKLTVTGTGKNLIPLTKAEQRAQVEAFLAQKGMKEELAKSGITPESLLTKVEEEQEDRNGNLLLEFQRAAQTLQVLRLKGHDKVDQLSALERASEDAGLRTVHLLGKVSQYFHLPEDPDETGELLTQIRKERFKSKYDIEDLLYILIKLGERRADAGKQSTSLPNALKKLTREDLRFILPPKRPTADYLEFKVKHSFVETFNSFKRLEKLYGDVKQSDIVKAVLNGEEPTIEQTTTALLIYVASQHTDQLISAEDALEAINMNPVPYFPKEEKVVTPNEA